MKRVLITGMSGTGKSTLIERLAALGFKAVDTDWNPEYELVDAGGVYGPDWIWREDRIEALLSTEDADLLFVSACVPNQAKFYSRFDSVILLTATPEVTAVRLAGRTNNPYGKHPDELARVLEDKQTVEPLLRRGATAEIDTDRPVDLVLGEVLRLAKA